MLQNVPPASKAAARVSTAESDERAIVSGETLERLKNVSIAKLSEIVKSRSGRGNAWDKGQSEIIAAKALLDRYEDKKSR